MRTKLISLSKFSRKKKKPLLLGCSGFLSGVTCPLSVTTTRFSFSKWSYCYTATSPGVLAVSIALAGWMHGESEPERGEWGGQQLCFRWGCFCFDCERPAALLVYSSCDIGVTFIQSAPAAASPQEASRGQMAARRDESESCLSWQTLPLGEVLLPLQKGQWRCIWRDGGDSRGRMGFFHFSSLSGNTFCCFFPRCLATEGRR